MLKVTSKSFVGQKQELSGADIPFRRLQVLFLFWVALGGRAGRQKGSIFAKAPQAHHVLDSALAPKLGGTAVLQRRGLAKVSPPLVPAAWAMQQGVS